MNVHTYVRTQYNTEYPRNIELGGKMTNGAEDHALVQLCWLVCSNKLKVNWPIVVTIT